MMNTDLVAKYSKPVPRYTSYPPANFFTSAIGEMEYRSILEASNADSPSHISVYVHIPFCMRLCHYCGCNAWMMRKQGEVNTYLEALKHEIRMVLPLLSQGRKVSQIHYGGGSPTSMPVEVIRELNAMILSEFECIENPEIAIECHPGYMNETYWQGLLASGFNRISLGVQDFNEEVLHISNRKPSLLPIREVMSLIREAKASVNLDFIYGLPAQTPETFARTIEQAIELRPDRLVTFSYAHVPWVNPRMMKLEEAGLPSSQIKAQLFAQTKDLLKGAGYEQIGLDHFVLPNDELAAAYRQRLLKRNFQGYCTARTTGQVYAFGVTGISQLATAYAQNEKDIDAYIARVQRNELPVVRGYVLSRQEQLAREVISQLMCNYEIRWQPLAEELGVSAEELKAATNYNEDALRTFEDDGIITFTNEAIIMQPSANQYVRNVAACLDKLMVNTDKQFSNAV